MAVSSVRIDFAHAQGEHRHRQKLETVLKRGSVFDFRKGRVFGTCFFVRRRLNRSQGSLDCRFGQLRIAD